MTKLDYSAASVPVRDDLTAAHQRVWQEIASPGTWFDGEARVAIAAEVRQSRDCRLCADRKEAISPYALTGSHDCAVSGPLLPAAVEVIHRLVSDPGRLSPRFYEEALTGGLTDAEYVEIVGVVVKTVTVDSFCQALGVALHPLPGPEPGKPSRRRPEGVGMERAWVPMLKTSRARGLEADLYPSRKAPNVVRALSLVPDEVRSMLRIGNAQYTPGTRILDVRYQRALNRPQMELIASRVSARNGCFY